MGFNHFDEKGNAVMVDVSEKAVTSRTATAKGTITGLPEVLTAIEGLLLDNLHHVVLRLPYSMGGQVELLHNNAQVISTYYTAEGIEIETIMDDILYGRLKAYVIKEL